MSTDESSSDGDVVEDSDEEFLMSMCGNDEDKNDEKEIETNALQTSSVGITKSKSTWNNIKDKSQSYNNPYSFNKNSIARDENKDPSSNVKQRKYVKDEQAKKRKQLESFFLLVR